MTPNFQSSTDQSSIRSNENNDCWCKLVADNYQRIVLSVISFDIPAYDKNCTHSGLYLQSDRKRNKECTHLHQQHYYISSSKILYLNYYSKSMQSDKNNEKRGSSDFWIIYEASDGKSKIRMKCGDTDEVRPFDFTRYVYLTSTSDPTAQYKKAKYTTRLSTLTSTTTASITSKIPQISSTEEIQILTYEDLNLNDSNEVLSKFDWFKNSSRKNVGNETPDSNSVIINDVYLSLNSEIDQIIDKETSTTKKVTALLLTTTTPILPLSTMNTSEVKINNISKINNKKVLISKFNHTINKIALDKVHNKTKQMSNNNRLNISSLFKEFFRNKFNKLTTTFISTTPNHTSTTTTTTTTITTTITTTSTTSTTTTTHITKRKPIYWLLTNNSPVAWSNKISSTDFSSTTELTTVYYSTQNKTISSPSKSMNKYSTNINYQKFFSILFQNRHQGKNNRTTKYYYKTNKKTTPYTLTTSITTTSTSPIILSTLTTSIKIIDAEIENNSTEFMSSVRGSDENQKYSLNQDGRLNRVTDRNRRINKKG
jgi:hypothetical protein